jgi:hypothetical protein
MRDNLLLSGPKRTVCLNGGHARALTRPTTSGAPRDRRHSYRLASYSCSVRSTQRERGGPNCERIFPSRLAAIIHLLACGWRWSRPRPTAPTGILPRVGTSGLSWWNSVPPPRSPRVRVPGRCLPGESHELVSVHWTRRDWRTTRSKWPSNHIRPYRRSIRVIARSARSRRCSGVCANGGTDFATPRRERIRPESERSGP